MVDTTTSIPATLRNTAARYPDLDALVDGDVRLSYRELDDAVIDAARALIALGVQPGDRVSIWAQNCWQWCVAALGIEAVGGIVVPLNTRFRGREAAQILDSCRPVALFTTTGFLDIDYPAMLREVAPQHADLPIIVMSGERAGKDLTWEEFIAGGAAVPRDEAERRVVAVAPHDVCDIMYTSGTTGFPKGVVLTHGKNLLAIGSFGEAIGLRPGDRNLVLAPLFAQFGLRSGLYMDIILGATTVLDSVFDGKRIIDLIEQERITVLPGPPTILAALLSPLAQGRDLGSLRIAITGSTVVPEDLVISLLDNKIFDNVMTAWGLTEACGPVSVSSLQDTPAQVSIYAGRVMDHLELKVVDPDGKTVPTGERGELLVRGPTVMNEYFGLPDETAATVDQDGWLSTGDVGSVDEGGYVQITGRLKDMVIVGGLNVYPAEVEATIREHETVRDVALIGIPDERLGEVGLAYVVPEGDFDEQELARWCREVLANYKVPRVFVPIDELPLNSSLKVDKLALRERASSISTPYA